MIIVIRIHGRAEVKTNIEETLRRLSIYRKYTATLVDENDSILAGMIKRLENYVCYGKIDDKTAKEIIAKRGQTLNGKKISEKEADKILGDIKKGEWKIKKFFRLHPPVGGFKKSTKLQAPKGILGDNKEKINELIRRML